jgi:hypothetical protein
MDDVRREQERELHTDDLAAGADRAEREMRERPREYEELPPDAGIPGRMAEGTNEPLFAPEEAESYRSEWSNIQIGFVDEPREAVEKADALVAKTIKRLAEVFAEERSGLERQWDRGDQISTEDLRIALRRYRSFFDRLLVV